MKTFADFGIDLRGRSGVEVQTTCPQCSSQRKKKKAACLSVNTDKGCWLCHHCGWSGSLGGEETRPNYRHWAKPTYRKPEPLSVEGLHERHLAWFAERGITAPVLERNRIATVTHWMPQREERVNCIAFPYLRDGELVNAKFRDLEKNFCLSAGAEPIFFGEDDIAETTIIVEGECDKLACEVAGFRNVVSVPHGAPTPEARDYSSKFDFIANCAKIDSVKTWILAVDSDAPGRALEAELARRLGRSICKRARWPSDCKDANEVLVKYGADALAEALRYPEEFPIEGVFSPMGESGNVMQLYRTGLERGVSTGWRSLDEHFTVRPGEMTVLTGIPNSGKSNVADSLAVNMCRLHGWRIAVCSPENQPVADYLARLTEKWTRKPFSDGPTPRMNEDEVFDALMALEEHVSVILPSDDMSIAGVLERAEQLVKRRGIKLLILDPWNEFEHKHGRDQTKTDYICETLTMIRAWGRRHGVHVLIVVHPTKLERQKDGNYPVPTLYDCEGCYTDDTEVLTKRGWLRHSDVSLSDEVACFDPATSAMVYANPSRIIRKEHNGDIYRFKGYGYDLAVTGEHRMLVRPEWDEPVGTQALNGIGRPVKWKKGEWQFCEASELPTSSFSIPLAGLYESATAPQIGEEVAAIAGWFVSEGWAGTCGGVVISQNVGEKAESIAALLDAAGVSFERRLIRPSAKGGTAPCVNFYIGARRNARLVRWLREACGRGSKNKRVPAEIMAGTYQEKRAFFDAYISGDGSARRGDSVQASTVSKILRDDLQRLALELGISCSWREFPPTNERHSTIWTVQFCRSTRTSTALRTSRNLTTEAYKGPVWCLTVPTGAYFVRRNGKAVVCGNSAHWRNKADNGLVVWRDFQAQHNEIEIHVVKIRFRQIGKLGIVPMRYEKPTATYAEAA